MTKRDPHCSATGRPDLLPLELQEKAEVRARETGAQLLPPSDVMTPEALQQTLHQLRVSQIELEMQNEDLRQAQTALSASQASYFDLYELAPVGYITLDEAGVMLEVNLTAASLLGIERSRMAGKPLAKFVFKQDRPVFLRHLRLMFQSGQGQTCELRMLRKDGSTVWVQLDANLTRNPDGSQRCRIILDNISDRKLAEEELRKFKAALDEHAIVAVTDARGVITYANEKFCSISQYTPEELLGQDHRILNSGWHPKSFFKELWLTISGGRVWKGEIKNRAKDGSYYWVNSSIVPFLDTNGKPTQFISIRSEITERKLAEQALQEWNQTLERRVAERTQELHYNKARFRQLTEATFEGIAITEDQLLYDGNAQLGELHGCELADMVGRTIEEFVAPESRALVANHIRQGKEATYEYVGLRKDGSRFPAEVHGRTGNWMGRPMRISAIRDLSEAKEAAARIQAQQAELEHAHRLSLVSEVSAGIIHQLGQPLCAMGANLLAITHQMKRDEVDRDEITDTLKDIEASVVCMRDAITHLRTLVRPEFRLARMRIDVNDWLVDILHPLRQEAENRGVALSVEFGRNLSPVMADAVQLNQVILILVRNAFDACEDFPQERRIVSISTRAHAESDLEVCVRDAGTGIAPVVQTRLFDPFFTTKPQGMGIGLRLSQTIVNVHGGTIEAFNNPDGVGATFRVVLPGNPAPDYTKG